MQIEVDLKKLLTDVGIDNKAMLKTSETINENCLIFLIYNKQIVFCVLLSEKFTESVTMDLKHLNGNLILYMNDHNTQFTSYREANELMHILMPL